MEEALTVDLTSFETALYHVGKIIGLVTFDKRNDKIYPANLRGKLYSSIILIMQLCSCTYVGMHLDAFALSPSAIIIFLTFAPLVTTTVYAGLLVAFKSDKIIESFCRMKLIDDQIKSLKIGGGECEKMSKYLGAKVIVSNLLVATTEVSLTYILHPDIDVLTRMVHGILMTATHLTIRNVLFIFTETMNCVTRRFAFLNEKLRNMFLKVSDTVHRPVYRTSGAFLAPENERIPTTADNEGAGKRVTTVDPDSGDTQLYKKRIKLILKIHQDLTKLVESTINLYEIPIFFRSVEHLGRAFRNFYFISHMLKGPKTETIYVHLTARLAQCTLIFITEISMIVDSCTSTCETGNKTNTVLYDVWCDFRRDARKLKSEFLMFSTTLLQKPVAVSAFNFIPVDYSVIFEIICVLIGYVILIVQLDL